MCGVNENGNKPKCILDFLENIGTTLFNSGVLTEDDKKKSLYEAKIVRANHMRAMRENANTGFKMMFAEQQTSPVYAPLILTTKAFVS